jgi:type VI secretion system protein ImpA
MNAQDTRFRYDIDRLLSPISSDNPAGVSLRYDPVYDQLREMRRGDDTDLPQGVWKSDPKKADWKAAEELCLEILETRSKDLQVAAWLLEAWIHLHGFGGAAEGFNVLRVLCDSFWDELHPRIENNDVEFRIAPFIWINRKIAIDLKLVPLTAPESENVAQHNWSDWENACLNGKASPSDSARAVTVAKFQQSVMLTPTLQLHETLGDVQRIFLTVEQLDALLDGKLKREAPGLSPVKTLAGSIAGLLSSVIELRGGPPEQPGTEPGISPPTGFSDDLLSSSDALVFAKIRSRSQAYQLLSEAAEYLARTEPHSPVPFLVRRAVSWGTMSLEALMAELVRTPNDLSEISRLLSFTDAQKYKSK